MVLSLRPKERHFGISLFCEWDTKEHQLFLGELKETVFKNNQSYSYETIYKAIEFPVILLQDIATFLHGSICLDSHDWIAECMILYNKQVALKLLEKNVGLLRAHKPANAEALKQFTEIHPDLKALAYEAARYEPTASNLVHASLGSVPYCHASSPIRRYADLVNQRCLKAILKGQQVEPETKELTQHLNIIQKKMRAYERTLFFLEQVAEAPSGKVEGLVVVTTDTKTKVYIPSWKKMIRLEPDAFLVGQPILVEYYADLQKPSWEKRMVFRYQTQ